MARAKRINFIGYCYVANYSSSQKIIYKTKDDYLYFEHLLHTYCLKYTVNLHNYALIGSEYHLLIETTSNNLSRFMGLINGMYARYYNKKYKMSGHVWKKRYACYYVTNIQSVPTIIRFIEQKPLRINTNMSWGDYAYSSARHFLDALERPASLDNAWMLKNYSKNTDYVKQFFSMKIDNEVLRILKKNSRKIEEYNLYKALEQNKLESYFTFEMSKKDRNIKILEAYREGFSQYKIAKIVGISQPAVHVIIKRLY